jgi:hypothetical protein
MIALLTLLAVLVPGARATQVVESPPAAGIEVYWARRAIAPHVSRIKSCQQLKRYEVRCLVVRHRRHETAHAVRYRREPGTKGIRVYFTPGWSKLASS